MYAHIERVKCGRSLLNGVVLHGQVSSLSWKCRSVLLVSSVPFVGNVVASVPCLGTRES